MRQCIIMVVIENEKILKFNMNNSSYRAIIRLLNPALQQAPDLKISKLSKRRGHLLLEIQ